MIHWTRAEGGKGFLCLHLASRALNNSNARNHSVTPPVLANDQLIQESSGSPAALTSMGLAITIATWALLIGINLWCLRKLFSGGATSYQKS
ncbi:MAG: hypothetical protein MK209_00935 [Planctomycetes bacterium]|nr:hypothetical protein [Planctomycetota bacterium]